jgi:hypothetical protein
LTSIEKNAKLNSVNKESRQLTYQESRDISSLVIPYHGVFYKFWSIVTPSFEFDEKRCPTAQVRFDKASNCLDFQINYDYWETLSDNQKAFVICHECLHVMLKHGTRGFFKEARLNPELSNMALDIPINHMLVDYFGFNRAEIDPDSKFCWIDTVFKADEVSNIEHGRNFEYYFDKIKNSKNIQKITVPNHSSLNSISGEGESQMEDAAADLTDEEKEALLDISDREAFKEMAKGKQGDKEGKDDKGESEGGKMAGSEAGQFRQTVKTPPPKPKRKWETIVKKWAAGFVRQTKVKSHWIVKPRRLASFNQGNMFIPSSMEMPKRTKSDKKIEVWLFQDTSGSCVDLAPRFFKAFESLPKDVFEVRAHCFDTRVFKLTERDVKTKTLYGFGGTTFSCIEQYIQGEMKKGAPRPKAVFVLTDGCGDSVKPKNPRDWYWFLSENYTRYIPKESKKFMLSEFE